MKFGSWQMAMFKRSLDELKRKPVFDRLIREKRFERYILLGNHAGTGAISAIYDNDVSCLFHENDAEKKVC